MTTARKQRMDAGGYINGRYFGHVAGTAVYDVVTGDGHYWVRARQRADAVASVERIERNASRDVHHYPTGPREPCGTCGSAWCVDPSCQASRWF